MALATPFFAICVGRSGDGAHFIHGFDDGIVTGWAAIAVTLGAEGVFASGGRSGVGGARTGIGFSASVLGLMRLGWGHVGSPQHDYLDAENRGSGIADRDKGVPGGSDWFVILAEVVE
jgi:hypothetical protein